MTINLNKNDMAMIRAAAQGLSGPEVEQFIADVRAELDHERSHQGKRRWSCKDV
jgi:hypothetical protein